MIWFLPAIVWTGCSLSSTSALNNLPNDGAISKEVEAKLASDQFGGLSGLSVTTEAGVVTLLGTVEKAEHKARAADLTRQVNGVKRVKNNLDIRSTRSE